jgi:hypothetical protein
LAIAVASTKNTGLGLGIPTGEIRSQNAVYWYSDVATASNGSTP